jgi:hypothetical protein
MGSPRCPYASTRDDAPLGQPWPDETVSICLVIGHGRGNQPNINRYSHSVMAPPLPTQGPV